MSCFFFVIVYSFFRLAFPLLKICKITWQLLLVKSYFNVYVYVYEEINQTLQTLFNISHISDATQRPILQNLFVIVNNVSFIVSERERLCLFHAGLVPKNMPQNIIYASVTHSTRTRRKMIFKMYISWFFVTTQTIELFQFSEAAKYNEWFVFVSRRFFSLSEFYSQYYRVDVMFYVNNTYSKCFFFLMKKALKHAMILVPKKQRNTTK